MDEVQDPLQSELERIRLTLLCDLVAVARINRRENRIRWTRVSGNITNRILQMSKKPGSGITGHVVRYGRPLTIDQTTPNLQQLRNNYPIMLAEQLVSVIAVPLYKNEQIEGVLLTGHRTEQTYSQEEVDETLRIAEPLSGFLL